MKNHPGPSVLDFHADDLVALGVERVRRMIEMELAVIQLNEMARPPLGLLVTRREFRPVLLRREVLAPRKPKVSKVKVAIIAAFITFACNTALVILGAS